MGDLAPGEEISFEIRLPPRERGILLAGGMLKYLRAGGREGVGVVESDSVSTKSGDPKSGNRS